MGKDNFEKMVEEYVDVEPCFEQISTKLGITKTTSKRRKFKFIIPTSIISVGTIIALLITLLTSIYNRPIPTQMDLVNTKDVVVEYEKNTKFVEGGYKLEKKLSDGQIVDVDEKEYKVDSSSFSKGEIGTYHISLYLNDNPDIKTGYNVEVVDDEIIGIELGDYRTIYYLGEVVIAQDITLNKIRKSGLIKEAKISEYEIDSSFYNPHQEGVYTINVSLKTNEVFSLSYQVEVKPLQEVELDGKYGFTDQYRSQGIPTIYALDIIDGIIYSRYSEILMNGPMIKEIIDGKLQIKTGPYSQTMIYNPEKRSLLVSGIANDPDMECFRLNRTDYLITLVGQLVDQHTPTYVAIDTHLSQKTIDHISYSYGGIYLDTSMNIEVDRQTTFTADTTVYVGVKKEIDSAKPYIGLWYDDLSNQIQLKIEENKIVIGKNEYSYTAQGKPGGLIWLRIDAYQVFQYNPNTDVIELLENEQVYLTLYRYNEITQAVVTLVLSNSVQELVVNKSEPLQINYYYDAEIRWYNIPGYNNEPIYEDTTFYGVSRSSFGFWDYSLKIYGTVQNYLYISTRMAFNKSGSKYPYWVRLYQDYQLVKEGGLSFVDKKEGYYHIAINYEDGTEEEIIHNVLTDTLTLNEIDYPCNNQPWSGLEILGDYKSENDKVINVTEGGYLKVQTSPTSFDLIQCFIRSYSEDEIVTEYIFQNNLDRIYYIQIIFEKSAEGSWSFVYQGVVYTKI